MHQPLSSANTIYCHFSLAALFRQCLQALIAIDLRQNAQCEIEHFGKNQRVRECPNVNSTHADTHRHTKKTIYAYTYEEKYT